MDNLRLASLALVLAVRPLHFLQLLLFLRFQKGSGCEAYDNSSKEERQNKRNGRKLLRKLPRHSVNRETHPRSLTKMHVVVRDNVLEHYLLLASTLDIPFDKQREKRV